MTHTAQPMPVRPFPGYATPWAQPHFAQSLDRTRPHELIAGSNRSHHLEYRYTDDGSHTLVPNCWYTQPVAWRVAAAREQVKMLREAIAKMTRSGPPTAGPGERPRTWYSLEEEWRDAIEQRTRMADTLEAAAERMERENIVLC